MELKECTTEDIDTLIHIASQAYREHYQYLWKDKGEQYIKDSYNRAAFATEIADENTAVYLTQVDNEDYGFFKVNLKAPINEYAANEALEIQRIYFIKKATGKGLGKAVMKRIELYAKKLNRKIVWLKAMDSSAAVSFYEKCGYTISGETRLNVEEIEPQFQRQVIMEKILI